MLGLVPCIVVVVNGLVPDSELPLVRYWTVILADCCFEADETFNCSPPPLYINNHMSTWRHTKFVDKFESQCRVICLKLLNPWSSERKKLSSDSQATAPQ